MVIANLAESRRLAADEANESAGRVQEQVAALERVAEGQDRRPTAAASDPGPTLDLRRAVRAYRGT